MDQVQMLIVVGALILVFLAARRFMWWYWGIDRMVKALESIDESLKVLPAVRTHYSQKANQRQRAA